MAEDRTLTLKISEVGCGAKCSLTCKRDSYFAPYADAHSTFVVNNWLFQHFFYFDLAQVPADLKLQCGSYCVLHRKLGEPSLALSNNTTNHDQQQYTTVCEPKRRCFRPNLCCNYSLGPGESDHASFLSCSSEIFFNNVHSQRIIRRRKLVPRCTRL